MGQKNGGKEDDYRPDGTGPRGEVEKFAESEKLYIPDVKNECVNELMKKIEAIRDSPEINDWLWKKVCRGSEQTEKK